MSRLRVSNLVVASVCLNLTEGGYAGLAAGTFLVAVIVWTILGWSPVGARS